MTKTKTEEGREIKKIHKIHHDREWGGRLGNFQKGWVNNSTSLWGGSVSKKVKGP